MRFTATGGGPPLINTAGETSKSSGSLVDGSGDPIGSWSYRCTYLGELTSATITHYCSITNSLEGRGKLVLAGGIVWDSNDVQWQTVIRATGRYGGHTGFAKLDNLNSASTSFTVYLVKG